MTDPIILHEDGTLVGEFQVDVDRLVEAGVLYHCQVDTMDEACPACGFKHRGPGFYHVAQGHTYDEV